jgi:hypothetical protein
MIVTTLVDMIKVGPNWYEAVIEIEPATCRHPWHRWWVEVNARTTGWPKSDDKGILNHYHMLDFEARSFRSAAIRGGKAIWKLEEYLEENPDDLPTSG